MKIQKNIQSLKTSATLAINELSQQLISEGKEVYKFGLGQSPFPVPKLIVNELKEHAHQKDYLNVSGLYALRRRLLNIIPVRINTLMTLKMSLLGQAQRN
jgi:aspartate/methionine/tyrosine aminotransferase